MMSVATETLHQTKSEVFQFIAMSESGSEAGKAAKKRLVQAFAPSHLDPTDRASESITAMPRESSVSSLAPPADRISDFCLSTDANLPTRAKAQGAPEQA